MAEHCRHLLRGITDQVLLLEEGRIAERFTGEEFFALDDERRRALGLRSLETPVPIGARRRGRECHGDTPAPIPPVSAPDAPTPPTTPAPTPPVSTPATPRGLVLDQVRFSYGRNRVLDIDHLEFPAGRICVLVGDNGAGKTTLARLLCGLVREDRGSRITLDARPANARTRTASSYIVMQDVHRQLFSETVRAEVTLGLSRSERREVDPDDLLARFGLSELAERHPLSLSGGQKQRLVLASAMACHKAVHIFDEPTSDVDERHLVGIAAQLRELTDQGAVVIVITHDLELLDACADRIVTLRPLRDIDEGAPQATVQDLLPSREDRTPDLLTTDRIGRHA